MTGWRAVRLGDVLTAVKRPVVLDPESLYRTLGVRWYGNGSFSKPAARGSKIAAKTLNEVHAGDVVYSKLFAWKGSFAVVADEHHGVLASTEFPTYLPSEELDPHFLMLWAGRQEVWDEADNASTGTTANSRNRLAPEQFLDFELDLPSLEEQRRVVQAVSIADRAVAAHQRHSASAFAALRAAREALLCTEDEWEELPFGWELKTLAEVADVRSGITKGRKAKGKLSETPFIRAANVQEGYLDLSEMKTLAVSEDERERFALRDGDILLVEGSGSPHRLGSGWLWKSHIDAPVVFQNHVFRVRPNPKRVLPAFVAHALRASPARAHFLDSGKTTSGLSTINKTQVSAAPIPVPPLEAQAELVARLDALRRVGTSEVRASSHLLLTRSALAEEFISGARTAP